MSSRAVLCSLCLASLCASPAPADDRALLIGVGRYRIQEADLPGVGEDLEMMREVARKLGFADSQIEVLADSEATLDGIREAIDRWLVAPTTAGDRVLFYHSGHGSRIPDLSGDESDGSDEALLPFDFEDLAGGPGGSPDERPPTGGPGLRNVLLDDELGRLLARIPAREVVALIDSCHSGTMNRSAGGRWISKSYRYRGMPSAGSDSLTEPTWARDSIVLLSAARPEEDAQTSRSGALFTRGVWRAVRDAEARQYLTLEELRRHAESYIRQEVGNREDLAHRPMLSGSRGLRSINLFLPRREASAAPAAPAAPAAGDLWHRLEWLVAGAGRPLTLEASQTSYRLGESLELSVAAGAAGYLHIWNVAGDGDELAVLYPNPYQSGRRLRPGETVHIPAFDRYRWPAWLPPDVPRQRNLVVAVLTAEPLELGGPDSGLDQGELERLLDSGLAPASAGQVVVTIER